jgi:hypothetical protein
VVTTVIVALELVLGAGGSRRSGRAEEVWRGMVQTGDALAAGQLTATLGGQPLTAAKAYLLAFHQAQDASDLEHVLVVADRLEAAGEPELAIHVRRAADTLLGEIARSIGTASPSDRAGRPSAFPARGVRR